MERLIRPTRTPATNSVYVAIAGEVINRRSVHLRNFVRNGTVSASKSAAAHTLDHCVLFYENANLIT